MEHSGIIRWLELLNVTGGNMQIDLSSEQIKQIVKGALYIAEALNICETEVIDFLCKNENITSDEAFILRTSDWREYKASDV